MGVWKDDRRVEKGLLHAPLVDRDDFVRRDRCVMGKKKLNQKLQDWVEARKRHRLSHAHVQMARELGFNPKKLGKIDNHKQEPWKLPLPAFIEELYFKRFGRKRPASVMPIGDQARVQEKKKAAMRAAKREGAAGGASEGPVVAPEIGVKPDTEEDGGRRV